MSTRTLLDDPDIQRAITVRVRQLRRGSAITRLGFIAARLNAVQLDSLTAIAQLMARPEAQTWKH